MAQYDDNDIAVIGIGLNFPGGATDAHSFYDLLLRGRSARGETPSNRFNLDAFYHPDPERLGALNVRNAHYLENDIAAFDAPFFSITSNEAHCMDPQQRGLLETVYHALENSGIPLEKAVGTKTSVYIGCFTREYDSVMARDPEVDLKYIATGTGSALLSNRLSWFYDFRGPSLTLDSACSSSLNAVHLGCQGLLTGETSMAVVGGCNLFYNPDTMIPLTSLGFLSPDGKCKAFDASADGYSRGEGFGIVVLKRVADAVRDGNTIRAIIRGTASNQDGRSAGITQPTRYGQAALIRDAYARAHLDPAETRFFEAHGTGTAMGDPIEASAISDVFTDLRSAPEPLYVGALKSNIGHLEGAAGIAGLIKAVMILENGVIPGNLWFSKVNPKIPADEWKLKFPVKPTLWPTDGVRRASINSFGYGGSNAHIVLDDALYYKQDRFGKRIHRTVRKPSVANLLGEGDGAAISSSVDNPRKKVFLFSANDEPGIKRVFSSYADYLERRSTQIDQPQQYLTDLAYTLSARRTHLTWRSVAVAEDIPSLQSVLKGHSSAVRSAPGGRLGLVFTGQGAQYAGMAQELLAIPIFKASLEAADKYMQSLGCKWSVVEELLRPEKQSRLGEAELSQPVCTCLQVALVEMLQSWRVPYGAVVGHSSGEVAAAFAAGAISRESAWRIAFYRGQVCAKIEGEGAMLAVGLSPAQTLEYLADVHPLKPDFLSIACFNSPKSVTVSGTATAIDALHELLDKKQVFNRKLRVRNAYHSLYMSKIAAEYAQLIGNIEPVTYTNGDAKHLSSPSYYSSVTAEQVPHHMLQKADYWVDNLVSPVRFSDSVARMLGEKAPKAKTNGTTSTWSPITDLLEVGPHAALQGPIREIADTVSGAKDVLYRSVLRRKTDAEEGALAAAGWLWARGYPINIEAVNGDADGSMLVDLPPYPFNHSKTFWRESRLSKGYRFRETPRLELLGAPVPDWSKSNAVWRNWIRLSENPWIKDHRVTGTLLYPGAGMLVMAIEASKQLLNPNKILKGFRMKEVAFQTAMRIPTTIDGLETHLYLRPHLDSTSSTSSSWNEFQISSMEGSEWRNHCRGLIQPEYEVPINPIDQGEEEQIYQQEVAEAFAAAEQSCKTTVKAKQLYELLRTTGFDFGETFQTLNDVSVDNQNSAVVTVTAADIQKIMPGGYVQPHLIHPTTLDGVIQSVIVALTRGGRDVRDAMVPSAIEHLYLSAEADVTYDTLRVRSSAERLGLRQATASLTAISPATGKPLIAIEGLISTAISKQSSEESSANGAHYHLCFNVDWKPDVTFLQQQTLKNLFTLPEPLATFDPTELIHDVEAICYMYLRRHMRNNALNKFTEAKPWYGKYIAWAKHQIERYERGDLLHKDNGNWNAIADDEAAFAKFEAKLQASSPEAKMSVVVGRALPGLLTGELDPLEVLFADSLMENVYRHGTGAEVCYSYLTGFLDSLAHKHSDLVILEVGAGTGGATVPILETLNRHGDTEVGAGRFARYDYTDISSSFFEVARDKFKKNVDRMRFETLNVEKDVVDQGFQLQEYDVIIAGNVVHATKNINHTLSNLCKLLKPGGKLLLHELTNTELIRTGFGFGLLPGWWLSEEPHRAWGPLMSIEDWDSHLKRSGFTGADLTFEDYESEPNRVNSIIVATAPTPTQEQRSLPHTMLWVESHKGLQKEVADQLSSSISALGAPTCEIVSTADLGNLADTALANKLCIALVDLEAPMFLDALDESRLQLLQKLTTHADTLLWLSAQGGPAPQDPRAEMLTGFARVLRQENPTLNFITLSLEDVGPAPEVTGSILEVVKATLVQKSIGGRVQDNSFHHAQGMIHISRIVEATYMNDAVALRTAQLAPQPEPFTAEEEKALKLVVGTPGLLDSLQFIEDAGHHEPLPPGHVEFRVEAAGLNFLDVMIALGQVIGTDIGVEGAGIVTRAGPESRFQAGDRVVGIAAGTFGTYARAMETSIAGMPANMSFHDAAGLSVVFVTAYCALYSIADIQAGESVLIHAAAGGVGQACIQLAKLRGATVYATVGSEEKRDLLIKEYGIAKENIFSSRDLTFARSIKRITRGRGVDVAVNSLSGDALRATWDCIAPFGRFVEVGKIDIYSSARLNMEKFKNNVSFEFVDISYLARNKGAKFAAIMEDLMHLFQQGHISPLHPTQTFTYGAVQEAFRYVQSGAHSGKIIIVPDAKELVPVVPSAKSGYTFDANASFVISGAMGGLGRSIARWMAGRGAKNLILLSRSGTTKEAGRELISDLEQMGVTVAAPACDVSNVQSVTTALRDCYERGMPPVKGCIQGAMVLNDVIFQNMTLAQYNAAVGPKVQASWNLHELLPKDLDFFILLSSIACILGNRGQANYNIGNAFQDALARYRVSRGQKATALDLGMILGAGYVAENDRDLVAHLRDVGVEPIREEEFHAILDELCRPHDGSTPLIQSQVTLGLQIPESRVATGAEEPGWMRDPLFKHLHRIHTLEGAVETDGQTVNYQPLLAAAENFEAASQIVFEALATKLIRALDISPEDIDPAKPLHALGVDSLVAVELRTWMLRHLDADVAVFDLMEVSSMKALAALIASRSGYVNNKEEEET